MKRSQFKEFPRDLAEEVRRSYPKLWSKHGTGGNPPTKWTGDDAYRAWGWLIDLREGRRPPKAEDAAAKAAYVKLAGHPWVGGSEGLYEAVTGLWWDKRERYISRHARDFRPGGTVAMIKWAGVFPWAEAEAPGRGERVMMQTLVGRSNPRHNGMRTSKQPDLFSDEDTSQPMDWRDASPDELLDAFEQGLFTSEEEDEIFEVIEDVQLGGREAALKHGLNDDLAHIFRDRGYVSDLEDVSLFGLEKALEDGNLSDEQLEKGEDLLGWETSSSILYDGPTYEWKVCRISGKDRFLYRRKKTSDDWDVTSTESAMDSFVEGHLDPEDFLDFKTGFFQFDVQGFWDDPPDLYHATTEDHVDDILEQGLLPMSQTRGLRNRFVGSAVFTTLDEDDAGSGIYGDFVFRIDTKKMRDDGHMPPVEFEPDVVEDAMLRAMAYALDVDFSVEAENDPDTIIVHGEIPSKYLTLISG